MWVGRSAGDEFLDISRALWNRRVSRPPLTSTSTSTLTAATPPPSVPSCQRDRRSYERHLDFIPRAGSVNVCISGSSCRRDLEGVAVLARVNCSLANGLLSCSNVWQFIRKSFFLPPSTIGVVRMPAHPGVPSFRGLVPNGRSCFLPCRLSGVRDSVCTYPAADHAFCVRRGHLVVSW